MVRKTGRDNLVSEHGFANTWFASKDLVLIASDNSKSDGNSCVLIGLIVWAWFD